MLFSVILNIFLKFTVELKPIYEDAEFSKTHQTIFPDEFFSHVGICDYSIYFTLTFYIIRVHDDIINFVFMKESLYFSAPIARLNLRSFPLIMAL